jgi:hypothetical protein
VWQFVGTVLALLAILLSLILYYKQRQKKALSYEVLSATPLLSVGGEIKGRVKILFDDEPVEDVGLFIVKIRNSGSVPIIKTDYEHRIKLNFGENIKILSSEIIETKPKNLPAKIHLQEKKVVCDSILLNADDSLTVKVLVSGSGDLSIDGRIQGVKEIINATFENKSSKTFSNLWMLMVLGFVFGFTVSFLRRSLGLSFSTGLVFLLLITGVLSIILILINGRFKFK